MKRKIEENGDEKEGNRRMKRKKIEGRDEKEENRRSR